MPTFTKSAATLRNKWKQKKTSEVLHCWLCIKYFTVHIVSDSEDRKNTKKKNRQDKIIYNFKLLFWADSSDHLQHFKGVVHPKIIFHTFTIYNFVDSGCGYISIPCSRSGVSWTEAITPKGWIWQPQTQPHNNITHPQYHRSSMETC